MATVIIALAAPAAANAGVFGSAGPFDGAAAQPLKINQSLVAAAASPSGFVENTVWSGLIAPSNLRFAADGSAYVAQLDGVVKKFDSVNDPTPTTVVDLSSQVAFFGDRGLIGMALDPQFTTGRPYIYVLYTYDGKIGGTAPLWNDNCPNPPGADIKGCVVSGRLSRINANTGAETVLIKDEWCQQYSSHSVGHLQFGPDGALYASAGDGASFTFADYGQDGSPVNPCGDPPGGVGGSMTPPTAEGGALRAQDALTSGDPTGLDGAIIRIDPDTGAPLSDNPGTGDTNAKRIVAYGLRNPFRFAFRPGTTDLYVGDVGWNTWEEINRVPNPTSAVRNYGWPCYEGTGKMSSYANLNLNVCNSLYSAGTATGPLFTYSHGSKVADETACTPGTSSTSGVVFYNGTSFPTAYNGALFFADYARGCIWSMAAGAGGVPDPTTRKVFVDGADTPVDLQIGPDGALYYVSVGSGIIHRVQAVNPNQAPTAHATATPQQGAAPLNVSFDGTGSTDPNGDPLTYAWDLDGDGLYNDSTAAKPALTYTTEGNHTVRLMVTDPSNASSTDQLTVQVGAPPVATLSAPTTGQSYAVSDLINFSGSAVDGHGAAMPASRLTWQVELHHCSATVVGSCHVHYLQTYNGVASGSYTYPDHEYPSYLTLVLTATDANGLTDTRSVRIDPKTVELTFTSSPSGLPMSVGAEESTTPFTRTVVQNGTVAVIAPTPQILGATSYDFTSWSNGGAAVHQFTAPTAATTYTATYTASPCPTYTGLVGQWGFDEASGTTATDGTGNGLNGSITGAVRSSTGRFGGALSFNGTSNVVTVADNAKLDLTTGMTLEGWVNPTTLAGSWRTVGIKENTGALVYALYATNDTNTPSGHVSTPAESDTRGTGTVPLNAWTHLATTYDGATLKMYVNGTLASSKAVTGSMPNSAGALRFGGNNVWGEYFGGKLDELRLYSRALTQAQVQSDMATPVTCSGAPPAPVLSTSPASLSFSATSGATDPASKTINVTNTGGGTLNYTVSDDQPWLSVSPVSGSAPGTITVAASVSGMAAGTYAGNVTVTASGASGSPKTIPVTFTVAAAPPGPTLATLPSSLAFSGVSGAADPGSKAIDVTNTGGSTLSYTVAKDQPWLTVSPTSGTAPGTITVSASLSGLAAGTYTGNVTVTASGASGSPKTIPVTFTVAAPPALGVTPSTLAFTAMQGGASPATQTVDVSNSGGGTLTYTVTKDQGWLTVTPTSGTAPSTLTVGANTAGLAPGSYTGTVTVTAPGASGSPKTVSVALTVNAAPPAPSGLVGAWGFDETSGTAATDASGNGLNGTVTGATRTTTGKFGGALSFNGTSNWVTVADNAKLDLTTKITMEGWVNATALGSTWRTVMIKEGASSLVYSLYASEGTSKASGHVFTSTEFDTRSTAAVALNTWTHLAATWDGATLKLYVNGTLVSSRPVTGTMPNSSGVLRFGGNGVWGEWFKGQLDELRLYNRALAQSEIQTDMTTPVSGAGLRAAIASATTAKKDVKKAATQRKGGAKPYKGTAHRKAQAPKAKYPGKHRRPR